MPDKEIMELTAQLVDYLKAHKIDSIGVKVTELGYKIAINDGMAYHAEYSVIR